MYDFISLSCYRHEVITGTASCEKLGTFATLSSAHAPARIISITRPVTMGMEPYLPSHSHGSHVHRYIPKYEAVFYKISNLLTKK